MYLVFTHIIIIIIIIKGISRAPIYHTRWQHRALYNNTNHTHTHTHTHSACCLRLFLDIYTRPFLLGHSLNFHAMKKETWNDKSSNIFLVFFTFKLLTLHSSQANYPGTSY